MSGSRRLQLARTRIALLDVRRQAGSLIVAGSPAAVFIVLLAASWALGGATRANLGYWAAIEVAALAGVAIAVLSSPHAPWPGEIRLPLALFGVLAVLVGLQLVPLPWAWWSSMPGHASIADSIRLFGLPEEWKSISLAPEQSVSALIKFVPAVSVFVIAAFLPWRMLGNLLSWFAVVAGSAAVVWALAQALGIGPHLYPWTNDGAASGAFANVNHQASFLLMCLPFVAVHAGRSRDRWQDGAQESEEKLLWASVGFVFLLGVAVAGSLFGYVFAPLVVAGCAAVASARIRRKRVGVLLGAVGLTLGVLAFAMTVAGLDSLTSAGQAADGRGRLDIYQSSMQAGLEFSPFGSGFGSFERVFPLYEDTTRVAGTNVNHAHNDYLEIFVELGLPGIVLLAALVGWIGLLAYRTWFGSSDYGALLRVKLAASLALLVVLTHSAVDYPLRAAAISCFAAACLAILVKRRDGPQNPQDRVRS